MKMARIRLILAALAFAAWIGWLGYLAATATGPTVLSRPQFLLAPYAVIAEVKADEDGPAAEVVVHEVYWPVQERTSLQGKSIQVTGLPRTDADGWKGPGAYLLPLTKIGTNAFRVVAIPPSPGYHGDQQLIYRVTEHNKHQIGVQLDSIHHAAPAGG